MQQKCLFYLLLLLIIPGVIFAQSGKLRGTVIDQKTKEPLIGANIVVEGTNLGAATDIDGSYIILNVSVGTYTLKASYIGYSSITISNVRVNANLTTEVKFELSSEDVRVQTVEIVAERPLINKNATNAVRIIDGDFFENLPSKGINAAITLQPGIVRIGDDFYVRGSRLDEVGFTIDGVPVTDIVSGGRSVSITAEAVEQIQVLAGGYQAEFGGANAGLVRSNLRSGGEQYHFGLIAETDRLAKEGKEFLNTYSYGYTDFTLIANGPVPYLQDKIRFFGSYQNTYYSRPNVRVWDGYDHTVTTFPVITPRSTSETDLQTDTIHIFSPAGNPQGGYEGRQTLTGTLGYFGKDFQLRASGSYSFDEDRPTTTFVNILNTKRLQINEAADAFGSLKVSWVLSPKTFVEASYNYSYNYAKSYDPDFKNDIFAYGDSLKNAALGYTLRAWGQNLDPYTIAWNVDGTSQGTTELPQFNQPGFQAATFSRATTIGTGGRLDVTSQVTNKIEVKFGGEYTRYEYRTFNPGDERRANIMELAKIKQTTFDTDSIEMKMRALHPNNIGYDLYGNEINGDVIKDGALTDKGPRHPVFAGAYAQSKIELSDIVINFGLRWDYLKSDGNGFVNPGWILRNDDISSILANQYTTMPAFSFMSPRIGFSFPVSDRTVFHAQYGRFIQMPRLQELYRGTQSEYEIISQKGGYFYDDPTGYGIRPEQTTQYEVGFNQLISDNAAFDITAFYKNIEDQLLYMNILPDPISVGQATYPAYTNGDFSTTKGLEFKFTLRRTNRVQVSASYTLSDARGTGSTPNTMSGTWGNPGVGGAFAPKYVFPVAFNQTHRGNFSIDYRFEKDDGGSILEQMGFNLLGQFNSGTSFTRYIANSQAVTDSRNRYPIEEVGASTTPWFFQIDARLDKTISIGRNIDLNLYVYVINLLGTDNVVSVFERSGDAKDDGWLATSTGQDRVSKFRNNASTFKQYYNELNQGRNSVDINGISNFGPPRQIRIGLKVTY
jgi:hypothetical protein